METQTQTSSFSCDGQWVGWLWSICVSGRWRRPGPERVLQGPCLRLRDQEEEDEQEEEEVAHQSRATAGTVSLIRNIWSFLQRPQEMTWWKPGLFFWFRIVLSDVRLRVKGQTKLVFLLAGEKGFRDSKALNDKTGSLHLGKTQLSSSSSVASDRDCRRKQSLKQTLAINFNAVVFVTLTD